MIIHLVQQYQQLSIFIKDKKLYLETIKNEDRYLSNVGIIHKLNKYSYKIHAHSSQKPTNRDMTIYNCLNNIISIKIVKVGMKKYVNIYQVHSINKSNMNMISKG